MSESFTAEALTFAFAYQMATRIVADDGKIGPHEKRFLEKNFPNADFMAHGFRNAEGKATPRWEEAIGEALMEVPGYPEAHRLQMLTKLWTAAMADDSMHPDEAHSIQHAARLLGLPADRLAAHLGTLRG